MGFSLFVSRLAGCPTVGDEFCADRPLQPAFSARRFFGTRGDTRFNAGYGLPGTLSRNETVLNQNWITGEMALFRQLSVVAAVSVPWVGRFRSQKQCPHHGRNISHGGVPKPMRNMSRSGSTLMTHYSLAYSASACLRIGMSGSASFHKERKSLYCLRAPLRSPIMTSARANCKRDNAPRMLFCTTPRWSRSLLNSVAAALPLCAER